MYEDTQNLYQGEIGEEEDEVVRELDVFVNNDLQLYLAQFPLKPVYSDPLEIKSVKYKPNHHKLELSVPYPSSIQSMIAKENSSSFGGGSSSSSYRQNNSNNNHNNNNNNKADLLTQKYTSSEIRQSNPLMVGFIQNNQLFLSEIERVLQFHPTMTQQHSNIKVEFLESDVDYEAALGDEEEIGVGGGGGGNSTSGQGGDNVKQIQLKRKESERAQNARLQSYSYIKQQEELEPWIHLKPHAIGSEQSDSKFLKIGELGKR